MNIIHILSPARPPKPQTIIHGEGCTGIRESVTNNTHVTCECGHTYETEAYLNRHIASQPKEEQADHYLVVE